MFIKVLLIALLGLMWSQCSNATILYQHEQDCEFIDKPLLKLDVVQSRSGISEDTEAEIAKLKQKLFVKLSRDYPEYQALAMVKVVPSVEYLAKDSTIFKVMAQAKVVTTCSAEIVQNGDDLKQFVRLGAMKPLNIERAITITPKAVPVVKPIAAKDLLLTCDTVLGLKLGSDITAAQALLGRFSLWWQINPNDAIALVGRNLALFYRQNQLIGFQYHIALLPTALNNRLEFLNDQAELAVQVSNTRLRLDAEISQTQEQQLTTNFAEVDIATYITGHEQSARKLLGLRQGQVITLASKQAALPCLTSLEAADAIAGEDLIEFYQQDNKPYYFTGCHQMLELDHSGSVTALELLDKISPKRIELSALQQWLERSQAWHFSGVNYLDTEQALSKLGQIEITGDFAELQSPQCYGHFELYDAQVVTGKLQCL